jgi:hypothetical protein
MEEYQYIVESREYREFIATQVNSIRLETRRILEHYYSLEVLVF